MGSFWHKVSFSQSTTKQAFSVGGIYHVTVRLSLEPDRPFLGHTGLWRFMHVLLLADDILRPTERSDHLGKADGARE